jgi:hypothetical protein
MNAYQFKATSYVLLRKFALCTGVVFSVAFFTPTAKAQGYLRADGKRIINERGENVLLRGMGLGGWMLQEGYMLRVNREGQQNKIRQRIDSLIGAKRTVEFYDAWLANGTRKIDIDSMRSWGFNSVRLPMHYNLYTLPVEQEPVAGSNTWLDKGFAMTDSLLRWCEANRLYLILDLHAAPGGQGNDLNISDGDTTKPSLWESEANKQKTIALWKKLAERYKDEPWIGAYDIINEPNWGFADTLNDRNGLQEKGNEPLKKLMVDITAAIREVDKKHIVIIEGNGWGNNYNGIFPPWDKNMVVSYHKYWNRNDTGSIRHILEAREKYNVPVWLGETGENSNVWFSEAIHLLESHNIGWAWWPLKKMGFNNPLEIKSNEDYDKLVAYWSGRGPTPAADAAYKGLMELARSARLENAVYHKDVIDAMFRQPFSHTARPYHSNRVVGKTEINAVDYDLGRNGVAYFDKDTADYRISGIRGTGNRGRTYRNDGVDIRRDSLRLSSYYVSDTEAGEWLQYTIDVAKPGKYTLGFSVASAGDTSSIEVKMNGVSAGPRLAVPNTGSLQAWQTAIMKHVPLRAGRQTLRIHVVRGGFNLATIQLVAE